MRSRARWVAPVVRCACSSSEEMKGEIVWGSSGETAPIAFQLCVRDSEMCSERLDMGINEVSSESEFASWG